MDWAPSINLGHETVPTLSVARYDRAVRRERRKRQREVEGILENECEIEETEVAGETEETSETMEMCEVTVGVIKSTQTLLTMNEVESLVELKEQHNSACREVTELQEKCEKLEQDNTSLRAEKEDLSQKVARLELNEDFFKDNDERVRYYTGLTNWNLLLIVIQFVQPFINVHSRSTLSAFQQVIMTLMRLRL